jgi:sodium-dependent phosphate cotransporter
MVAAFSHLFFNLFAIGIIYPIPAIRNIPIRLAEWISELALKNKFIPLIYLLLLFIILPLTMIYLGGN